MSEKRWSEINYAAVPSQCMKRNHDLFRKHDGQRFKAYLADVATKGVKINTATLKPHEIVGALLNNKDERVAELQWADLIATMGKNGEFVDAVAMCDVGQAMSGIPLQVGIGLSLIVAEMTKAPWHNHVITFSDAPAFHDVTLNAKTLKERVCKMKDSSNPYYNTNLVAVFRLILCRAKAAQLATDDMVRTVFIFSAMQFTEAVSGVDETAFERIRREYAEAGYKMPLLVFWNLNSCGNVPALQQDNNVVLVSGYSSNMLKFFVQSFLQRGTNQEPQHFMQTVIGQERYKDLKIID